MHHDTHNRDQESHSGRPSIARRREILKRIGQASVAAGAAASPMAAMATGGRKWCKHLATNKCVHASISGMGSVVLSAQTSDEVCGKKVTHYNTCGSWPSSCHNGTQAITCNNVNDSLNTKFCVAFKCTGWTVKDSVGVQRCDQYGNANPNCLLNKSLPTLCSAHPTSAEARWATALGNANKLATPTTGAPFPYTPGQVVGYYGSTDLVMKASAYQFFTNYCENYA